MLVHPMKKVLTSKSNCRVQRLVLSSTRSKSEAVKASLKSIPFEDTPRDGSSKPENASCTRGVGSNATANPKDSSKSDAGSICGLNATSATQSGFRSENTLPTECRVLEFDEIPCPSFIKWASKLLSYIPALSTQVTANLVRNGLLPVQHLLNNYGPVVRLSGPFGGPILLVARPDLLEAVFAEEGQEPEGIGFDSLRHYRQQKCVDTSTSSHSVPISRPLSSLQTRAALASAASYVHAPLINGLEKTADEFVAAVRTARSPQGEVDSDTALQQWAVKSAVFAAFGQSLEEIDADAERTQEAFDTASKALRQCEAGLQLWRWFMTPSWIKLESALDVLHRAFGKRVWAEHGRLQLEEPTEKPRCILDALLRIGLHPDAAISVIVELILVAGNTTACAAGMLLYELSRHPRHQRAVLDELKPHLSSPRSKFAGGLPSLPFLDACVKEALRLHPPIPTLSRVLPRAARLHQYHVPQGTVVVLAAGQCAKRADQFEDAERFRPHRWLEEDPGRHPLAGLPWGGGARACPAASIAAMQVALLAAKTVRAFQLEHEYGQVRLTGQVLAKPSRPLKLRFVDRVN